MNLLEIDTKKYIPKILEAVIEIWGEEYRNILIEKANKIKNINYIDERGIWYYHQFLEDCIQKYFSLKFLEEIGVDTSEADKNIRLPLDSNTKEQMRQYFGNRCIFRPDFWKDAEGMFSFDKEVIEDYHKKVVEDGQIKFLNLLRGKEEITVSNYKQFKETKEYSKLLKQIYHYLDIYKKLDNEMKKYNKKIQKYRDYVDSEDKRKERIMDLKRCELYQEIESELPEALKEHLNLKYQTLEQKSRSLFPDLDEKNYIEFFSKKDEESLETENYDIYALRLYYLRNVGIHNDPYVYDNSEEKYKECLNQPGTLGFIPSFELVDRITKTREKKYEEGIKEFVFTSETFLKNFGWFDNLEQTKEYLYNLILNRTKVANIPLADEKDSYPAIFFTVRPSYNGILDIAYIHEFIHALLYFSLYNMEWGTGFDICDSDHALPNPYRKDKRKYERLNETITDIYAIKVKNILHKKEIYLFEPKELVDEYDSGWNTSPIVRKMLNPFLESFHHEVILSLVTANYSILLDKIGSDNFEELNDCINKVDYLITCGLDLENPEHKPELVIEYKKEMSRLEEIYHNMDNRIQLVTEIHQHNHS